MLARRVVEYAWGTLLEMENIHMSMLEWINVIIVVKEWHAELADARQLAHKSLRRRLRLRLSVLPRLRSSRRRIISSARLQPSRPRVAPSAP